jgi:hypothetical protein
MLLLVLLFVLAAGTAAFIASQRLHKSSDGSSAPSASVPSTVAHTTHVAAAKHPAAAAARHPKSTAAARQATAVKPVLKAKPKPAAPAPPNQLPLAIRRALAHHRVVVVALYDPNAAIDGSALSEAKAGAKLGGGVFVPIDVRRKAVDSLNARYGAVQDPAVLVLSPPGSLVVRIDGFADRDTVAQAAQNAKS